jgi:hypothetical protein
VLPILSLKREDLVVPELAEELAIFWDDDSRKPICWDEAIRLLNEQAMFDYGLVRRLARHPLIDPLPTVDDLLRSPPWALPLLRRHVHRLNFPTRDYLIRSAKECLSADLRSGAYVAQETTVDGHGAPIVTKSIKYLTLSETALRGNAYAAPPIVELCREFGGELVSELACGVAEQLPRLKDPRMATSLVYLLLTPWTLP